MPRSGRSPRIVPGLMILLLLTCLCTAGTWVLSPSVARASGVGAPPPVAPAPTDDALGRGTPRGSITGFLEAAREGDYARAAQYLDTSRLPSSIRSVEPAALARELRVIIDQTLAINPDALSDEPEGLRQEHLAADRQLVGTIRSAKGPVSVLLQRVSDGRGGRIWKISAATVAQVPGLYREVGYGPLGEILPAAFFEVRFLDIALWQWIALLLLVAISFAASWVAAVWLVRLLQPLAARTATMFDDTILAAAVAPLRLALGVLVFFAGSIPLGLSIPARQFFGDLERALALVVVAWLVIRTTDVLGDLAVDYLARRGRHSATAIVPPGRKVAKVVVVGLAFLAGLQTFGVNVTGVLAGLGLGGLAVALAAQKTVENLFGGVTLILDQPVRVGDFCRFGDKLGTVEDVGLRSTRVRTLDRTVVSIPNGQFSSFELENYSKRDRIRLHTTLGLRYETSPDQLRYLLIEIRRMLYSHPKIDHEPARVRFVSFGAYSLDLEIFAYVLTTDYDAFLAVREDAYLRIMDIVAASGTGFAFPSQTTYFSRDTGVDERKTEAAGAQVRQWREDGSLCLPDFPKETVAALRGTLDFPPRGAASGTGSS